MWKSQAASTNFDSVLMNSKTAPFQFVEAYKSLRTNLSFALSDPKYKDIVITSSIPGEGKSTVALNLAIALAESANRVLLVDTDLRKSIMHRYLHIGNNKNNGLTQILANIRKLEECIMYLQELNLYFLPTGPLPTNPAELLGSSKMKELIDLLNSQFDYIVFDTPPVSVVTDAAVLSKFCDGVVLVTRQNFTSIDSAKMAVNNLKNVGANIIGGVLNGFEAEKSNKAYSYYHYKKYGYKYKY